VLQPIDGDDNSIFKLGSTIPAKFKLTNPATGNSAGISNCTAKLFVAQVSNNTIGSDLEATSTSAADSGNTFRYDPTADQYIFNLASKPLSTGTWLIKIDFSDGSGDAGCDRVNNRGVCVSLRK